jgi:hypothetical protein
MSPFDFRLADAGIVRHQDVGIAVDGIGFGRRGWLHWRRRGDINDRRGRCGYINRRRGLCIAVATRQAFEQVEPEGRALGSSDSRDSQTDDLPKEIGEPIAAAG